MFGFKKKSKLTISQEKKHPRWYKFRKWLSKWHRTIAAVVGVALFCTLLVLLIIDLIVFKEERAEKVAEDVEEVEEVEEVAISVQYREIRPRRTYCTYDDIGDSQGLLSCEGGTVPELCNEINTAAADQPITQLRLTNIQYTDETLDEGWLTCVTITLQKLTIAGNSLKTISGKAFNGSPFSRLYYLVLSRTNVLNFNRGMFEGPVLTNVEIDCTGSGTFEQNTFGALSQSLQILQVANCIFQIGEDVLTNITGSHETLKSLVMLDVRHNDLRKVTSTSFRSVTGLTTLHLDSSVITEIEVGALNDLFLTSLTLDNNQLNTLPEGSFDDISGKISIASNPWRCDCDLLWLKELFTNRPSLLETKFECNDNGKYTPYEDVSFCDETTAAEPTVPMNATTTPTTTTATTPRTTPRTPPTPTTTTTATPRTTTTIPSKSTTTTVKTLTTTTTPTTTTSTPVPQMTVQCIEQSISVVEKDVVPTNELLVRHKTVSIRFHQPDEKEPTYLINITGDLRLDSVLWFNSENIWDSHCINNVTEGYSEIGYTLERGKTYTFCLVPPDNDQTSPFDCAAMTVPEIKEKVLLTEDDMIPVIAGICGALIAVAVITGIIVFYCIRQHPSLIKGNKRVIIVESEAADAIVMPSSYYDEINYPYPAPSLTSRAPSLNSRSNGYLTPTHHGVYCPRPSQLRTISENTDLVIIPSTSGKRVRKRSQLKGKMQMENAADEHLYEAPPLPPNHPSGMIYTDSWRRSHSRI